MNPVIDKILEERYQRSFHNNELVEDRWSAVRKFGQDIWSAISKGSDEAVEAGTKVGDEAVEAGTKASDDAAKSTGEPSTVDDALRGEAPPEPTTKKVPYSETEAGKKAAEAQAKSQKELAQAQAQRNAERAAESEKAAERTSAQVEADAANKASGIKPAAEGEIAVVGDTADDVLAARAAKKEAEEAAKLRKTTNVADEAAGAGKAADEAAGAGKAADDAAKAKKGGKLRTLGALAAAALAGGKGSSVKGGGIYNPSGSEARIQGPNLSTTTLGQFSRGYVLA